MILQFPARETEARKMSNQPLWPQVAASGCSGTEDGAGVSSSPQQVTEFRRQARISRRALFGEDKANQRTVVSKNRARVGIGPQERLFPTPSSPQLPRPGQARPGQETASPTSFSPAAS